MKRPAPFNSILIFALGQKLFVHADEIIRKGNMGVYSQSGCEVLKMPVCDAEYFSVSLNVEPGIYLVKLNTETTKIEKRTFIGKE